MRDSTSGGRDLGGVFYVAPSELPTSFERITAWVELLLAEHRHVVGLRGLVDLSHLISRDPPPVSYIRAFVEALQPLLATTRNSRCALLVRSQPLLWRARLLETLTSASRVRFRAFDDPGEALAWLDVVKLQPANYREPGPGDAEPA